MRSPQPVIVFVFAVLALLGVIGRAPAEPDATGPPPAVAGPWHLLSDPFASDYSSRLTDLVAAPDGAVYVSAFPGGVAKSSDHGATWSLINTGLPDLHVVALGVNSLGEPIASVGNQPAIGAFRYRNGRWTAASGISATLRITAFTLDKTGAIIAVTAWAGDVFRSTDNGNSYYKTASSIGQRGGALWTVALGSDGNLYAGGETAEGLFISRDNGTTWQQSGLSADQGYKGNIFSILSDSLDDLLVGRTNASTGSDIQRLSGGYWSESSQGIPGWMNVLSLAKDSHGALYATASLHGRAGVYRSADSGRTWQDYTFGIGSPVYRRIAVDPAGDLYLIAQNAVYRAGLARSPQ